MEQAVAVADTWMTASEAVVLVLCLLLSACFSAAEMSLSALGAGKAQALVDAGGRGRALKLWLNKPHHVLTAVLIGNHAANTVIAVMSALIAQRVSSSVIVCVAVAVAVVTALVFGEIVPRSFARHHALTLAPLLMPVVVVTYVLTFPLVLLFTRLSHLLVRLSGAPASRMGPHVSEDEIASLIRLGEGEGVIGKQEGQMLTSIFELGDTVVREVMVPRTEIAALPIDAQLDEVVLESRDKGHSRMPVFDGSLDEVKGFFHSKDLLDVLALRDRDDAPPFALRDHLRPVLFVPELMKVSELLKLFQRKKTHLAVVVDEYGGTAGIVALEDVLEEIVGPIEDEHDEEEFDWKRLDDNHVLAEGRAVLWELGEALHIAFPDDGGYETLGGFLIARCGRLPSKGDHVSYGGWTFVVKEADERRVSRIDIERAALPTAESAATVDAPPG